MKSELKTERLTLKPVNQSDLDILHTIFTNKFVRQYLFDDEIFGPKQTEDFIGISNETFNDKKYGLWLIEFDETRVIIGFTGLWHFFDEAQPQLLYALLPEYTRQGFAAEAARKIIEYAFLELSFNYLKPVRN